MPDQNRQPLTDRDTNIWLSIIENWNIKDDEDDETVMLSDITPTVFSDFLLSIENPARRITANRRP